MLRMLEPIEIKRLKQVENEIRDLQGLIMHRKIAVATLPLESVSGRLNARILCGLEKELEIRYDEMDDIVGRN